MEQNFKKVSYTMPLPLFTDQQIYRRQPQNVHVISRVFPIFQNIHLEMSKCTGTFHGINCMTRFSQR